LPALAPSAQARTAAEALCAQAALSEWSGPDIYDALGARWPSALTGGKRRRQALIQLHARSPVDLRPLSRRSHARIAKAVALFAAADLRLGQLGDAEAGARARHALQLLAGDVSAGPVAWGYPWDVQTRWSFYRAGSPNVIVTAFSIETLRAAGRALNDTALTERADAAARWVQDELFVPDLGAYAYHPGSGSVIHNASLLGARAAWPLGDSDPNVRASVARAVERTLAAQADDGSFPYGEGPGLEWVDSFHTAYVLECLADLQEVDPGAVSPALERGAAYWQEHFFDGRGRALLWPDREFPEDGHSAGSGLTALVRLAAAGLDTMPLVERVAERTATAMVKQGHGVHRRYRWGPTRVRYVRWASAHLAFGLANAAFALKA
jgi:hypothetical protein